MTTKSTVESSRPENMGEFLYYLDPDTRKIRRNLEKNKIENNKQCSIDFN